MSSLVFLPPRVSAPSCVTTAPAPTTVSLSVTLDGPSPNITPGHSQSPSPSPPISPVAKNTKPRRFINSTPRSAPTVWDEPDIEPPRPNPQDEEDDKETRNSRPQRANRYSVERDKNAQLNAASVTTPTNNSGSITKQPTPSTSNAAPSALQVSIPANNAQIDILSPAVAAAMSSASSLTLPPPPAPLPEMSPSLLSPLSPTSNWSSPTVSLPTSPISAASPIPPVAPPKLTARHTAGGAMVMDSQQIERLKEQFRDPETGRFDKALDIQEFVTAFASVLGKTRREFKHMFMKIDANSDGSIDWDEFTNFMLMENQGSEEDTRDATVEFRRALRLEQHDNRPTSMRINYHIDMITRLIIIDKYDRYVTGSRDGTLRFWSRDLTHLKTIQHSECWITDICYMKLANRVAVASMDRVITFYDPVTFDAVSRVSGSNHLTSSPTCIDSSVIHDDLEIVLAGDDRGDVLVCLFQRSDWHVCDGKGGLTCKHDIDSPTSACIQHTNIMRIPRLHDDAITALRYDSRLSMIVSASLDCTIKQLDVNKIEMLSHSGVNVISDTSVGGANSCVKRAFTGHTKGIYSFDYSKKWKFMASCGLERKILLWDPFTCKVVHTLSGPTSSNHQVLIDDETNLLFCLSFDKTIRVWDLKNNFSQIQTIVDTTQYRPENRIMSLLLDGSRLLAVSSRIGVYRAHVLRARGPRSHQSPLCSAMYIKNFNQVVSGDSKGTVAVWDVDTGRIVTKFETGCKITAMCFDNGKRRLLTGHSDGTLKMWNFSNGQCLTEFENASRRKLEITGVEYVVIDKAHSLSKYIVSVGWDRRVSVYLEGEEEKHEVLYTMPRTSRSHGHKDDILCVAVCKFQIVATGGYDGTICLWHFDSNQYHAKLLPSPTYLQDTPLISRAVEKLVWLPRKEVLFSCGADGYIRAWSIQSACLIFERAAMIGRSRSENILALKVDDDERFLFTGDSNGHVMAWDINQFKYSVDEERRVTVDPLTCMIPIAHFQAHKQSIVSVDYLSSYKLILTASTDCTVLLWTRAGVMVGMFGQAISPEFYWDLHDPSTYHGIIFPNSGLPDQSIVDEEEEADTTDEKGKRKALKRPAALAPVCSSIFYDESPPHTPIEDEGRTRSNTPERPPTPPPKSTVTSLVQELEEHKHQQENEHTITIDHDVTDEKESGHPILAPSSSTSSLTSPSANTSSRTSPTIKSLQINISTSNLTNMKPLSLNTGTLASPHMSQPVSASQSARASRRNSITSVGGLLSPTSLAPPGSDSAAKSASTSNQASKASLLGTSTPRRGAAGNSGSMNSLVSQLNNTTFNTKSSSIFTPTHALLSPKHTSEFSSMLNSKDGFKEFKASIFQSDASDDDEQERERDKKWRLRKNKDNEPVKVGELGTFRLHAPKEPRALQHQSLSAAAIRKRLSSAAPPSPAAVAQALNSTTMRRRERDDISHKKIGHLRDYAIETVPYDTRDRDDEDDENHYTSGR